MFSFPKKHRPLLISTLVFFIIINTLQLWEGKLGILAVLLMSILMACYVVLFIILMVQVVFAIREKGRDWQRLLILGVGALVLGLTAQKPTGLINWEALSGKDLLVAEAEGAANCMTTFKLKTGNRFTERIVCFGVDEMSGGYTIKNDTIFFVYEGTSGRRDQQYEFGLIRPSTTASEKPSYLLYRYKNKADTVGRFLWVRKNELLK